MMEEKGLARREVGAELMEQAIIQGDLSKLTPKQRVEYYGELCKSLGLNPLTKPFDYITLNNRLVLYAKKDCTDQIRANRGISIAIVGRELVEGVYVVTAKGTDKYDRTDESIGAVAIDTLKGDARANALMKAETKAKRRVTLSLGGLGWLDEIEIETVSDAKLVKVDANTGEIEAQISPAPAPPAPPNTPQATTEAVEGKAEPTFEAKVATKFPKAKVSTTTKTDMEKLDLEFEAFLKEELGAEGANLAGILETWNGAPKTRERLDMAKILLRQPVKAKQGGLTEDMYNQPEPTDEEGQS